MFGRHSTRFGRAVGLGPSVVASLLADVLVFGGTCWAADAAETGPDISGVWQLVGRLGKDGKVTTTDEHALKFSMSGRFCVTFVDPKTGLVAIHHGGTYTLQGNEYAETIGYANESTSALIRRTLPFEIHVDSDTLTQTGRGQRSGEVWKRVQWGETPPLSKGSPSPRKRLDGVWELVGKRAEDGRVASTGQHAVKFVSSGRFSVTIFDPKTGLVNVHHGGTYVLREDEYAEAIAYANRSTGALLNRTLQFEIQVDGETLAQRNPGRTEVELWKRAQPGESGPQRTGDLAPAAPPSKTGSELATLFQSGQLLEAAKLAAEALETTPDDLQLNLLAGRALTDAGEYEKARPYLERVISLDQESALPTAWAHVCFGQAQYAKGDFDGTRKELLQALEYRPGKVGRRRAAALLSKVGGHSAFSDWRSLETDHLRIHVPPNTEIDDLRRYASEKDADLAQLQEFFQAELPGKIDVFVWNDHTDSEPAMHRPLGFAYPNYLLVHTRLRQTRGHELAHVISHHAAKPTRRSRFIDEGTAVRFDLTGRDRMATARRVVREANLRSLSIVKLWETADSLPEATLYPLAGAFVDRLIERGGRDKYMSLLQCPTLEHAHEVYGDQFAEIVAEFERDLATEPESDGKGD